MIIPVYYDKNPQLVNVHTGVVATLGAEGRLGSGSRVVKLYDASDGGHRGAGIGARWRSTTSREGSLIPSTR